MILANMTGPGMSGWVNGHDIYYRIKEAVYKKSDIELNSLARRIAG